MSASFFSPSSNVILPYAFMDLDDTLFQTKRKINAWQMATDENTLVCAAVNKQKEPLSFMSARQNAFVNWLFASTELIAVTARDKDEIQRVKLPFASWQVLTHGALIMTSEGAPLKIWQEKMQLALTPLQDKLNSLTALIQPLSNEELTFTPHIDHFCDEELMIYLAIKHPQKDHDALATLAKKLPLLIPNFADDFYIHVNANNLAILPNAIHKKNAVSFLLETYLDPNRPSFGFGDSLADLPFLQALDWYGMPARGQLHDHLNASI